MKRFTTPEQPIGPEQFKTALGQIGINQSQFARWIDVDPRTVRLWASGRYPVPLPVSHLLTLMLLTETRPGE